MEESQNKRMKLEKSTSGAEMIKTKLPLPDEIYLKIFSYLCTNDILENVARVCQEFYRLSKENKTESVQTCKEKVRDVDKMKTRTSNHAKSFSILPKVIQSSVNK